VSTKSNRYVTLSYILRSKWFINPQYAEAYYPAVFQMMENVQAGAWDDNEPTDEIPKVSNAAIYAISEFGEAAPPEAAPDGSIALINMVGAITKYDYCGAAGVNTKTNLLDRALANPNIKGVILRIDSGGGDGDATEVLANKINQAAKPVIAYVDGMAASAAYKIIAGASHIMLSGQSAEVGSIGAYVGFVNMQKYYEKMGVEVKRIYAPQSTLKNKPWEDALKGSEDAMKDYLKEYVQFFIDDVKAMRGNKLTSDDRIFKGDMFFANEAISIGLADSIGTMDDAVSIINQSSATNITNNNMKKLSITAGLTALAAFFGLESGKDHEVEPTAEQLATLNSQVAENATLKADISRLTNELQAANDKATNLQTEVTNLTNTIGEKDAEITRLGNVTAGANAAGGQNAAVTTAAEGGAQEANGFLSDVDKQVADLRASIYGKENSK
jgi:signal peptide peptidase SppA